MTVTFEQIIRIFEIVWQGILTGTGTGIGSYFGVRYFATKIDNRFKKMRRKK